MLFLYIFYVLDMDHLSLQVLQNTGETNLALVLWVDFLVSLFQFMHFIFTYV